MLQIGESTGTWPTYKKMAFMPRFEVDFNSFSKLHKLANSARQRGTTSRFASHLALYFPEVAILIEEGDFGFLHLEIGALKLSSMNAIKHADWYTVRKHFNFIADMAEHVGQELLDAIRVSYLGNLFYDESSPNHFKARSLLPKPLVTLLEEIEHHYDELAYQRK